MTHIQQQRELNAITKSEVQQLLQWDDLQYGQFQFDAAYAYLRDSMQLEDCWINSMTKVERFWQWWINQWNQRDIHCFLPNVHKFEVPASDIYRFIHSAKFIDHHPSKQLLDEAYAKMVGDTWDDFKMEALCEK